MAHQGYGFCEFLTEEDAEYACKIMNQIKLWGKPIRVNKVCLSIGQELLMTESFSNGCRLHRTRSSWTLARIYLLAALTKTWTNGCFMIRLLPLGCWLLPLRCVSTTSNFFLSAVRDRVHLVVFCVLAILIM